MACPAGCISRKYKVKTSVAIAVDVQRLQKCQHHRTIGRSVTRGMKTPVPLAPGFHFGIPLQRLLVLYEGVFRAVKILFFMFGMAQWRPAVAVRLLATPRSEFSRAAVLLPRRKETAAEWVLIFVYVTVAMLVQKKSQFDAFGSACYGASLRQKHSRGSSGQLSQQFPSIPRFGHVQSPWIVPVLIPGLQSWTHDVPW